MKALLFLTLAAFTSLGIDQKECAIIIVKDLDKIEYEDIIDVIFFDDDGEYSLSDCIAASPSPEPQPEPEKE